MNRKHHFNDLNLGKDMPSTMSQRRFECGLLAKLGLVITSVPNIIKSVPSGVGTRNDSSCGIIIIIIITLIY